MASLLSLASAIMNGSSFMSKGAEHVYIIPVDTALGSPDYTEGRAIQYWPAELSDNHSPSYTNKAIPGGNLPLYQWVSGGERQISFTATFSRDTSVEITSLIEDKHNVDVTGAIKWLRSLCETTYTQGVQFADPPPLLYLVFPNNQLGVVSEDYLLTFMSQCDVSRKKWFPDGKLRLADVNLAFVEVVQGPKNTKFYGSESYYGSSMEKYTYKKGNKPKGSF